jgi:hypothetical protein
MTIHKMLKTICYMILLYDDGVHINEGNATYERSTTNNWSFPTNKCW